MHEHLLAAVWPATVQRGEESGGLDLVLVDADILGWATQAGSLSLVDVAALGTACSDLEAVLPSLPVDARPYFDRLVRLAHLTLAAA